MRQDYPIAYQTGGTLTTASSGLVGPVGAQGENGSNYSVPKEISIKPLNYGYLVRIGCQEVAVENYKTLIKNLESYLKDPKKFEENWAKKKELL